MENGCEVHEETKGFGELAENSSNVINGNDFAKDSENGALDIQCGGLSSYTTETNDSPKSSSQKLDASEGQNIEILSESVSISKNDSRETDDTVSESLTPKTSDTVVGIDEEHNGGNNLESTGSNNVDSLCLANHSKTVITFTNDGPEEGLSSTQESCTILLNRSDRDVSESSKIKGAKRDQADRTESSVYENSASDQPVTNFQDTIATSRVEKSPTFEGDDNPSNPTCHESNDPMENFEDCDLNNLCLITFVKKPFKSIDNFLKGCKWAPDGTTLLATSEDCHLRLFDLPHSLYGKTVWDKSDLLQEIPVSLDMLEGGSIRDFAWYPKMSSLDPSTCRFVCTSTGAPVHLWDSVNGGLRATYAGYDYADEVTSAYSINFSIDGEKILGGYKHEVKIFQTDIPGRIYTTLNIKKVSNFYNRGIVSCIQENPEMRSVIAVGTYHKQIGLYTTNGDFVCSFIGHRGGITHLRFSQDGSKLYSGARKDGEILCWDLRKPGKVLYTMTRSVETNQRIYFDFEAEGSHLVSGGTDGIVKFWELNSATLPFSGRELKPCATFKAHEDCISGISFNSKYPVLATGSGQRLCLEFNSDVEDEILFKPSKLMKKEVNLKLWWLGKCHK